MDFYVKRHMSNAIWTIETNSSHLFSYIVKFFFFLHINDYWFSFSLFFFVPSPVFGIFCTQIVSVHLFFFIIIVAVCCWFAQLTNGIRVKMIRNVFNNVILCSVGFFFVWVAVHQTVTQHYSQPYHISSHTTLNRINWKI